MPLLNVMACFKSKPYLKNNPRLQTALVCLWLDHGSFFNDVSLAFATLLD